MSEGRIALFLTVDEALVLEAFLTRGQDAGDDYSSIEDQAELRVLWDMAALLEAQPPLRTTPSMLEMLPQPAPRSVTAPGDIPGH